MSAVQSNFWKAADNSQIMVEVLGVMLIKQGFHRPCVSHSQCCPAAESPGEFNSALPPSPESRSPDLGQGLASDVRKGVLTSADATVCLRSDSDPLMIRASQILSRLRGGRVSRL